MSHALNNANPDSLENRIRVAREVLRGASGWVVALSGGVDSGALLALAADTVGASAVIAATAVSPAVRRADIRDARRVARHVGVDHRLVSTGELARPDYRANRGDRCFHCRSELFDRLAALRRDWPGARLAYGAIGDDLGDHRPGMRAARDHGVEAPLLVAGFTKSDARQVARRFRLPVAERPADACLASRLPVGTPVTVARLRRVAAAEARLAELGCRGHRVRDHGPIARIELRDADWGRFADPDLRHRAVAAVGATGFDHVVLDLRGYRPGGAGTAPRGIDPQRDNGP